MRPLCSAVLQSLLPDWPAHKKECKTKQIERTLFRAAQLFRECYYLFREKTFEFDVRSIRKEGRDLVVKTGTFVGDVCGIFMRFPNELCKNEEDRRAVLGMKMCTLAHAYFHDFITSTLQDSSLTLEELFIRVRSTPSATMLESSISDPYFMSTGRYMHTVLLVRSRRPELEWVIDITGAQFGIQQPVFSLEGYKNLYVTNIDSNTPLGLQNRIVKRMAEKVTISGVRDLATLQAMDSFMRGVKKWEQYEGLTLSKLLSVSDDEFQVQKRKLLGYAGTWLDRFVRTSNFLGLTMEASDLERKDPGRGQRIQKEVNVEIVLADWKDPI